MTKVFLSSVIILLSVICAFGQTSNDNSDKVVTELVKNSQNGFTVKLKFPSPDFSTIHTEAEDFTQVTIPGCYPSTTVGNPNLPLFKKLIEIPVGASVEIKVNSINSEVIKLPANPDGSDISPVHAPVPKLPGATISWSKSNKVYAQSNWYSEGSAWTEQIGIMRDANIGNFIFSPIEYNPKAGKIRFTSEVEIEVIFHNANAYQSFKNKFTEDAFSVSSLTLNGAAFMSTSAMNATAPATYIILADSMFKQSLQPFINWKTQMGYEIIELYKGQNGVGTTAAAMKAAIQTIYDNSSKPPLYLLIVGDTPQIPSFNGTTGNHPSDMYYVEFTGDILPEMLVGRFSATTVNELQSQLNKTLEYEQYLMSDPGFLDETVLIAGHDNSFGPLHANGQIYYAETYYHNTAHNINASAYYYPGSSSSVIQIVNDINNGAGWVNYTAHGSVNGWVDPAITSSTINSLTNAGKYPLMIGNACSTNSFHYSECFGEKVLRADNKGGIGYIGASDLSYWDEDYYWAVGVGVPSPTPVMANYTSGIYDLNFHENGEPYSQWAMSQGQILQQGNLAVTQAGSSVTYYWEIYNLMGDPSLMPFVGIPTMMTASYSDTIITGLTNYIVNTEPYSYVGVSCADTLIGGGFADQFGIANLQIKSFTSPAQAILTITAQNKIPFIDTIEVILPVGPYITLDSLSISDMLGDQDMLIDVSETIDLNVRLHNITSFQADQVSARLICNDPYITLIDSTEAWGNIVATSKSTVNAAFKFDVAAFVPDQYYGIADLQIEDTIGNQWNYSFNFLINAPVIEIVNIVIEDSVNGNNNGAMDPGETVDLKVLLTNTGHEGISNVSVDLSVNSQYVTILSPAQNLSQLDPANQDWVVFQAKVDTGHQIAGNFGQLMAYAFSGNYEDSLSLFKMLGHLAEDFELAVNDKFNWDTTGTRAWFRTTYLPFEGTYCSQSGLINNNQESGMEVSLEVLSPDTIYFARKVSSEADFDQLYFMIDGTTLDKWSGNIPWGSVKFPVDSGYHTFTWLYEKDYSQASGLDAAWVDYIIFPPSDIFNSVENLENDIAINIYPVPTSGIINIETDINNKTVSVLLMTLEGQILQNRTNILGSTTIDLSDLSNGIYYLVIHSDNKLVRTQKILKF